MPKLINKLNPFNNTKLRIEFHTPLRESWIRYVSECRKMIKPTEKSEVIELYFGSKLEKKKLLPCSYCFIVVLY